MAERSGDVEAFFFGYRCWSFSERISVDGKRNNVIKLKIKERNKKETTLNR